MSRRAPRRGRSSSVSLLHSTSEVNAVCWSQDQRVAVTASQAIYILVSCFHKLVKGRFPTGANWLLHFLTI